MREFWKGVSLLMLAVGVFGGAIAWADDRPSAITWGFRIAGPTVVLMGLMLFLTVHFRRDRAPDFLSRHCKAFFDQNGFCFYVFPVAVNGAFALRMLYQNREDRPSLAQVVLEPATGSFPPNAVKPLTFLVSSGPGAFGMADMVFPVKAGQKGLGQKFSVGATVEYPAGKGKTLRFRDGITVRYNAEFRSTFGCVLFWLALYGGGIFWMTPASTTIPIPDGMTAAVFERMQLTVTELWRLGDDSAADVVLRGCA